MVQNRQVLCCFDVQVEVNLCIKIFLKVSMLVIAGGWSG